jgi:hypothetical protein
VVIAYQDTATRDRALAVCDYLVGTFGEEIVFQFTWWKFGFLAEPVLARHAAESLVKADLFFVAAHSNVELPEEVKRWIEDALSRRGGGEGMLVAMVGTTTDRGRGLTPQHNYLRSLAYQASMDYLPRIVEESNEGLPDSPGEVEHRATQITPVLDRILHRR